MEMTDIEIVKSYRAAKEKKKQITILADLNLCQKEDIIAILVAGGVNRKELPRERKKKAPVAKSLIETDMPSDKENSATSPKFTDLQNTLILLALQEYRCKLVKSIADEQSKHDEFMAYNSERVQEIDFIMQVIEANENKEKN